MKTYTYPGLIERIKAALIDAVFLILLMYLASILFSYFENTPNTARIGAFVFIFLLYDPFLTSMTGGTIGHKFNSLRVTREKDLEKNVQFPFAIIRFLLKAALGWVSLVTVSGNVKKMAIHDIAAGSVVVYQKK
jgi:uncharacterized RDD family membrane protein YckC